MKGFLHRLELNNKQMTLAFKHAGVARHAYNWGVQLCKEYSEKRDKLPSSIALHKLLVKDVKSEFAWYYEVSKCSPQEALRDLNDGWTNYFRNLKNGTIEKKKAAYIKERKRKGLPVNGKKLFDFGKPKFKKRGMKDSFYLEGKIVIKGDKIKLPIFGWVKMSEKHKEEFTVKNVVVSRKAGDFFISFKREITINKIEGIELKPTVGVDLGIKTLATLSDGKQFKNVRAFKTNKRKLKIAQRKVSKKYKEDEKVQSNNYKKANKKVAKIHQRIANVRSDATHKLTTYLAKNHSLIGIEDLNVKGMMKNGRLSNEIADGGVYEARRQLGYKTDWYGSKLVVIDRLYPSSKTCSCCKKVKKDLKLSDRIFNCDGCGLSMDRDENAAINIEELAVSLYRFACGELSNPVNFGRELNEAGIRQRTPNIENVQVCVSS